MSDKTCIAIDLGASGGRVALGWLEAGRLTMEVAHRFEHQPVPIRGALYWDIVGLWREVRHGLHLAAVRARALGRTVSSLGVDSWAVDYALLDEYDALIDGVRCYRDPRTDGLVAHTLARVPKERIYASTGIQFLGLNTLFQLLAAQRDAPRQLERARALLLLPDLLHFWLTGRKLAERSNASTTQFYDPRSGDWARDLLSELKLPDHFLPEPVAAGTVIAPLEPSLAAELGLEGALVVAVGTHDTASAVAATPLSTAQSAYISSGTWSLVGLETPVPVLSASALEANFTNEAGVHGTNRLLKNVTGLWIVQQCRAAWGDLDWATLYAEAAAASTAARIDPDDPRLAAPGPDMPERLRALCRETGQAEPGSRGETVRLALESLAAACAKTISQLEAISGRAVDTVHVVGGGAQVALLNQLTADAVQRPVIAGPVEATLLGNLGLQLEALGEIPRGGLRDVVRASSALERFTPRGGL